MIHSHLQRKSLENALRKPRVTEKSSTLSGGNIYTFDIPSGFNKIEVAKAITLIYNVKPIRVNVITIPRKRMLNRGKPGVKGGGKKAFVYLKAVDKIEFV